MNIPLITATYNFIDLLLITDSTGGKLRKRIKHQTSSVFFQTRGLINALYL